MKRKCKTCAKVRRVLPASIRRKLETLEDRLVKATPQEKSGESRKA